MQGNYNKKMLSIFIVLMIIFNTAFIAYADNSIDLDCKSALLMDAATGTIIYEMNPNVKLEPASVTKIMTMLLTMEALDSGKISLDDDVIISGNVSKMVTGTRLMLEEGEVRTVEDLLYGIAVESANDASIAMGEHICGSEEEFVNLMNKKAKDLGMNDTKFLNSHGLHIEGHVTSANDIGIMSRELLKHPKIFDYISKYMVTVYVGKKNDVERELVNKNKMVRFFEDVDGIKTGFTDNAMYCISATAKRNNLRLISVIMGSPKTTVRNRDARKLLDFGFANYLNYSVGRKGDIVKKIKVNKGNLNYVEIVFEKDADLLLKKGEEKDLKKVLILPKEILAPISQGEKLGEVVVKKQGKDIGHFNLVSNSDIQKASFINNIKKSLHYWIR